MVLGQLMVMCYQPEKPDHLVTFLLTLQLTNARTIRRPPRLRDGSFIFNSFASFFSALTPITCTAFSGELPTPVIGLG